MKKKIKAITLCIVMLLSLFTGCVQNDIGIKMNKNETGSISATIGIEKSFYENLKQLGSDPFEGKTIPEYTYEDSTYVSYAEVKEYDSYEEMENALLEMTYETDIIEDAQSSKDPEQNNGLETEEKVSDPSSEDVFDIITDGKDIDTTIDSENDSTVSDLEEKDNHIFSSVHIEKNSGIFYSSYSFNAVINPQSNEGLDYDLNETFKVTLTVEMPDEITTSNCGKIEGNKVTFDIADITANQELSAACESNNTAIVIGVVVGLVIVIVGLACLVKFKK